MLKRGQKLSTNELKNFMDYAKRLDDATWANKLVAHLAEIFPDLKKPDTELGKEMLDLAREYMLKYPGYRSAKLSEEDLKKKRN